MENLEEEFMEMAVRFPEMEGKGIMHDTTGADLGKLERGGCIARENFAN